MPAVVAVGPDGQFAGLGEEGRPPLPGALAACQRPGRGPRDIGRRQRRAQPGLRLGQGWGLQRLPGRWAMAAEGAAWYLAASGRQDQPQLPCAAGPEAGQRRLFITHHPTLGAVPRRPADTPARLDQQDGTELVARLAFDLPEGWKSIETSWPRIGKGSFASTTCRACSIARPAGCLPATWAAAALAWARPK